MLQFFRNFFKSKVGIVVTLGFLGLIAVAFASADVASSGSFGGVSGGDRVAIVGDTRITTAQLSMNANSALDQMRQENPTISMEAFTANGGMDDLLTDMMSRTALSEFGRKYGMRAGRRLVDSEITQVAAFQDASGKVTPDSMAAALRQLGMTEEFVRGRFSDGAYMTQVVTGLDFAPVMPASMARTYAKLLQERRNGFIGLVPSAAYAPQGDPTPEQLQTFYDENQSDFIRPERRKIRFGTFGEQAVGELTAPSEEQIAERYSDDVSEYEALEKRSFTQLVAPTQAAARAIADQVAGGKSLSQAASDTGLAVSDTGSLSQVDLAGGASQAVAEAGFATEQGALSQPAQGNLGWYILQFDSAENRAARSLDDARSDISATIAAEQSRAAFNDLTSRIEEELDDGRNLAEVAEELGIELTTTKSVIATGQVYQEEETAPPILAPVFELAFQLREAEPQLAVVTPGQEYIIFDIAEITESAAAPFDDIQENITAGWRITEGAKSAKEAAARIMARLDDGMSMREALNEEEADLPPPDNVNLTSQEVAAQQQVPPVLALFFSMAQGTNKRLEAPNSAGWFLAQLDEISTPDIEEGDPVIAVAASQLGQSLGGEYIAQFVTAVENEIGTQRNDTAVAAVVAQLTGKTILDD